MKYFKQSRRDLKGFSSTKVRCKLALMQLFGILLVVCLTDAQTCRSETQSDI